MMEITMNRFYDEVLELIDQVYEKEDQNIKKAASLCAKSIANSGVIHVFGSGHSIGFGLEMKDRPGSLAPVHNIETTDFVLRGLFSLAEFKDQDNIFERRPHIADQLYQLYDIRPEDVFIIISNSGINGVVIDMALTAKEKGHPLVVVTSWQHTTAEASRHPSGKKLYELADVVIDNCGPQGDALMQAEGKEKVCSVSSITGACIAQSLTTEIILDLQRNKIEVPLFLEEKEERSKKRNQELKEKYRGRI